VWVGRDSWALIEVPPRVGTLPHALASALRVCGDLSLEDLLDGWQRWASKSPRPPPPDLVGARAWLQARPEFAISNDCVMVVGDADIPDEPVLSLLATSLSGGPLRRMQLVADLAAEGVPQGTLDGYLAYSPAVRSAGSGLWQLRGATAGVRAEPRQRLSPRTEWRWLPDGSLELRVTYTGSAVTVPVATRSLLSGRIWTSDEGLLEVAPNGRIGGFSQVLRARGVAPGDRILVSFDVVLGHARLVGPVDVSNER
jgi:hypothetical protein